MSGDDRDERAARVESVLRAASRIADVNDPLGMEARRRLPGTSGLSPEGVALALAHHLETGASADGLDTLIDACPPAPRCHVVLAANVCTAAVRASACAVASAAEVFVRPSRRDPVVAELLARALADDDAFTGRLWLNDVVEPESGEVLHVYGRDETIAAYRDQLPEDVSLWAHGTGLGVAVVEESVGLDSAATAFAQDLVPFDGRGCLSPRLVVVHGEMRRAQAFAAAAHAALTREGDAIPRGPLEANDAAALVRYRDTMVTIGEAFEGDHHLLSFDPAPESLALGPALRCALVIPATEVPAPLRRLVTHIAAVGFGGEGPLAAELAALAPGARRSALGMMQRPPLDGPVDLRARL